jgi:two-component system, cell cycle sensor histidine kinase and response regulator CckA
VLREAGFATLEAADGLEALALLDGKPSVPALALIDVALPNMDGPTLARELERARPGMPVLFMTGYTSDEAMRDSAVGQGHPLIEKPFTADALVRRVRQSLDAGARREASA